MTKCEICGEEAVTKAYYGPVRQRADTWGHDWPYEKNHTFRCGKHRYSPDDPVGPLWLWKHKSMFPHDFE